MKLQAFGSNHCITWKSGYCLSM